MNSSFHEPQVEEFIAKYAPDIAVQLREARASLRSLFERGFELVFNNYNALVFGISPTERASDSFISVAGYPKWVTLFFLHGVELHDPEGLLEGSGKQVRSIRLNSPADLKKPEVEALIVQAVRSHELALLAAPKLTTIVKIAVAKHRPRRPTSKATTVKTPPPRKRSRVQK